MGITLFGNSPLLPALSRSLHPGPVLVYLLSALELGNLTMVRKNLAMLGEMTLMGGQELLLIRTIFLYFASPPQGVLQATEALSREEEFPHIESQRNLIVPLGSTDRRPGEFLDSLRSKTRPETTGGES